MLISFSYQYWQYPFLMSVFFFFQLLPLESVKIFQDSMLFPLSNSVFLLLSIIPEFIIRYRTNSPNNSQNAKDTFVNKNMVFEPVLNEKYTKWSSYPWFATVGIFNFISNMTYTKYAYLHSDGYSTLQTILGIIITWALCYVIFKKKLYKHHLFALIIFVIAASYFYLIDIPYLEKIIQDLHYLQGIAMFFIVQVTYAVSSSFQNTNEHYLIIIKYYSEYIILFIEGVVSLVLCLLWMIISIYTPEISKESLFSFMNFAKWKHISKEVQNIIATWPIHHKLFIISYFICGLLMNIFRIQTNKLLTPSHQYMGEILFIMYYFIYDAIVEDEIKWLIDRFFNAIILLLALFIFNENIIIKCMGLHRNTYQEISKRAKEEHMLMKMNEISQFNLIDNETV